MRPKRHITWLSVVIASLLAACETTGETLSTPAIITESNAETQATLTAAVSKAVGPKVTLAPESFTAKPSITIEPKSVNKRDGRIIDGRSMEMPTHVDLIMTGESCYVVNRDTGDKVMLDGVNCKAAPKG